HPRTRLRIQEFAIATECIQLCEPLSYLEFLAFEAHATVVLTDSGGIQEETTFLGVPCLTLRENTERPVTVEVRTNILVANSTERVRVELANIVSGRPKK